MSRYFHALEPLALLLMAAAMIVYTCRECMTEPEALLATAAVAERVLVIDPGHGGERRRCCFLPGKSGEPYQLPNCR